VLLYKGLAVDELVSDLPDRVRDALYSGQVSVVTYVVAAGLSLVGVFLGGLAVSYQIVRDSVFVTVMQFTYSSVPWLALAALTASAGRLLDELISDEAVSSHYMNLPFGVVAVGLVIRGFSGYFLERERVLAHLVLFGRVTLSPAQRLTLFIVAGIVISIVGVRIAANMSDDALEEVAEP
jgi:putative membrane protein